MLPAASPSIFTGIRLAGAYCITALVVAKLFFVELSNRGGREVIVLDAHLQFAFAQPDPQ